MTRGLKPVVVSIAHSKGEVSATKKALHKQKLRVRSFERRIKGGNAVVTVFLVCGYEGTAPNA